MGSTRQGLSDGSAAEPREAMRRFRVRRRSRPPALAGYRSSRSLRRKCFKLRSTTCRVLLRHGGDRGGLVFVLAFTAVGVVVARREPRNPIGWLLLAVVLSVDAGTLADLRSS